jgi:hypothetical protein
MHAKEIFSLNMTYISDFMSLYINIPAHSKDGVHPQKDKVTLLENGALKHHTSLWPCNY